MSLIFTELTGHSPEGAGLCGLLEIAAYHLSSEMGKRTY